MKAKFTISAESLTAAQRACSVPGKDPRGYLSYLCFDRSGSCLVGTDGSVMVEAPIMITESGEDEQVLFRLGTKISESWGEVTIDLETLTAQGFRSNHFARVELDTDGGKYPDWRRVSLHHGNNFGPPEDAAWIPAFGLDVSLLAKLNKKGAYKLEVRSPDWTIRATPLYADYRVTVMPIRIK